MSFGYMMSPYTSKHYDKKKAQAEEENRYQLALEACAYLLNKGFNVYSPIVHCHVMAQKFQLPGNADFWEKFNNSILSKASYGILLAIPGYQSSDGIQNKELPLFKQIATPVFTGSCGREIVKELPSWLAS